MKLVRPAPTSPDWSSEVECKECLALLGIERDDLFRRHVHDVSGKRDVMYCACLHCGNEITIADGGETNTDEIAPYGLIPTFEEWSRTHVVPKRRDIRPRRARRL